LAYPEGTLSNSQTCSTPSGDTGTLDCKPKQVQLIAPPTAGDTVLQDDGIAEQPEQSLLDSQNDANVPPTGYIEQNPSTTQSSPGGGVDISIKENNIEQPITPQESHEGEDGCSQ